MFSSQLKEEQDRESTALQDSDACSEIHFSMSHDYTAKGQFAQKSYSIQFSISAESDSIKDSYLIQQQRYFQQVEMRVCKVYT